MNRAKKKQIIVFFIIFMIYQPVYSILSFVFIHILIYISLLNYRIPYFVNVVLFSTYHQAQILYRSCHVGNLCCLVSGAAFNGKYFGHLNKYCFSTLLIYQHNSFVQKSASQYSNESSHISHTKDNLKTYKSTHNLLLG